MDVQLYWNSFVAVTWLRRIHCIVILHFAFSGLATAQVLHGLYDGVGTFGPMEVQSISDFNGDGVDDLVASHEYFAAGSGQGAATVLSGRDLHPLGPVILSLSGGGNLRQQRVIPDFDGDGIEDALWTLGDGVPQRPFSAEVRSLRTGQQLAHLPNPSNYTYWGWCIAGIGDIDGDGFGDVLVGGDDTDFFVRGGPDGHFIRMHTIPAGPYTNGAGVGDVDQDGVPDYAISSAGASSVWMFSGATGALLWHVSETTWFYEYGYSLTALGDVDGDGAGDLAVGAPRYVPQINSRGFVDVLSGRSGNRLRRIQTWAPLALEFGSSIGGGGDVDGDGVPDIVISDGSLSATYLEVHSLRTGTLLWRWRDPSVRSHGIPTTIVGDLDGDGRAEWALAYYYPTTLPAGRVWVFRGGFGDATSFCPGTPNSTGAPAHLEWYGPCNAGARDHSIRIESAPPNSFVQLVYGVAQSPVPFGNGFLCVGGPSLFRFGAPFAVDGTGAVYEFRTSAVLTTGAGAWTPGAAVSVQALYRDAGTGGGFNTTNAWRLVLAP